MPRFPKLSTRSGGSSLSTRGTPRGERSGLSGLSGGGGPLTGRGLGTEAQRAIPRSEGAETPGRLQAYRTDMFTYFTTPGGTEEVTAFPGWARVKVQLESAGPVAIGTTPELQPILGGRGILLDTDEPETFVVAKGTRLYIAAGTVERVKITIEPIPWLEEIAVRIDMVARTFKQTVAAAVRSVARSAGGRVAAAEIEGVGDDIPCPPKTRKPSPLRRGPRR